MNLPSLGECTARRLRLRLPEPVICIEAPRGYPLYFSALGTRIVATHRRDPFGDGSVPDGFLPIVDVRWRGVTFGPGQVFHDIPIYLAVGKWMFAFDTFAVRKLSFEPLWPPRLENRSGGDIGWSWLELPRSPFNREDVTSYAVHPDGQTILFSTESDPEPTLHHDGRILCDGHTSLATFTFDTEKHLWKQQGEWALPFTGRAHFVHCLQAFVGLSKDPATFGHLCSSEATATIGPPVWKMSKENLFSKDPAETHVSATLVYTGNMSEFCLLQCVSIERGHSSNVADQNLEEEGQLQGGGGEVLRCCSYRYRLTMFALHYDDNGDLTTGGTSHVQCYKVPKETTEKFVREDPVAFWL